MGYITFGPIHRSVKEEEVWTTEYRDLREARSSIAHWIEEYNHDGRTTESEIVPRTRRS